jgi:hypothetical protein
MPFGKFKGVPIAKIPDSYLDWLYGLDNLRDPLRQSVEQEWTRRHASTGERPSWVSAPVRQMAENLVREGYRRLTHRLHPDVGGSTEAMATLNAAVDVLRGLLGTLDRGA